MHDRASYATACAGASIGNAQPINDPLGLLPEHLNSITFEWNAHLIKQKISGNYLRILNAIYHQTIDFNKWEDDLAGKRLQQLTHIRYDHSNFIIKRLYERNIILKRKGSFGSIVSINFNFATWGKQYKQDEPHDANNDPSLLLSEEIRNNPIDDGIDLGLSDDFHAQPMVTQKTTPADADIPTEKPKLKPQPKADIPAEKPQPKAKVITPITDKDDANIQIEPQSKPIETASITVIDPVTNKVETLQEVIEQEVLRFQDQKRQALKAQITELEQRLDNQNTLEKQFVEQNQYVQTIKVQQEQQAKKIAELEQIKQETQEYKLQQSEKIAELEQTGQATQEYTLQQADLYDQKIAELEQNLQQQQEYATQQQQVAEQTIQENVELQAKQAQQQAKITAYQAQLAQAETKQTEIKSEAKQSDESQLDQQNKTQTIESDNQNYTHHIEPNNQNNNPFVQAKFPISPQSQLHVSPYIIDAVTTSLNNTNSDQDNHNQPKSDLDQGADNQSESDINPTDQHQAVPEFDLENIHYADNIPVELRKDLAKLLPETGQHAQKLLDIFSAQLSNPNQSIQNPIVNFAHLIQRLQTGELDIEDTETLIARARGDKTPKQHKFDRCFEELETARHTADLNKQHYLEHYQREAQANHMSVEQYIEDQDQMDFWQELCSTLKQSEYAIRDLMTQDV